MKAVNFIKKYINEVIQEVKKVSWPSREQTLNKTVLVVVVSAVVALYIGGIDILLQKMIQALLVD